MEELCPRLQPLRIPQGWLVGYNDFCELDVSLQGLQEFYFREDLLQISNPVSGILIDLGWYPAGDMDGQFVLQVFQGDLEGPRVARVGSRSRLEIVEAIELSLVRHQR